ncbi:MAG: hypothetical protein IKW20_04225 [Bacteroidales bacterium]|nr:hypothetical protein [Bacteroidales bacterium]
MKAKHADKPIFYVCLVMSLVLLVASFLLPPQGVIDPSVLTATGILFAFAALGVAGQNLANGKDVTFKKGDMEVTIDDEK